MSAGKGTASLIIGLFVFYYGLIHFLPRFGIKLPFFRTFTFMPYILFSLLIFGGIFLFMDATANEEGIIKTLSVIVGLVVLAIGLTSLLSLAGINLPIISNLLIPTIMIGQVINIIAGLLLIIGSFYAFGD